MTCHPDKLKRTGSQWTRRWREIDSNLRSPEGSVRCKRRSSRTSWYKLGAGTALVQLDLSCAACHSAEPGAAIGFGGLRFGALLERLCLLAQLGGVASPQNQALSQRRK
jgi:hypothetical protein